MITALMTFTITAIGMYYALASYLLIAQAFLSRKIDWEDPALKNVINRAMHFQNLNKARNAKKED